MTHKMLVKNAASSRAIPFRKNLENVRDNMFIPHAYQKNHKGMQGNDYHTDENDIVFFDYTWKNAFNCASSLAEQLDEKGVTKQITNRLLEPFQHITVLMTGTEWDNFFELRSSKYKKCFGEGYWNSYNDLIGEVKDLEVTNDMLQKNLFIERLELNKGMAELHFRELVEAMWDIYNRVEYNTLEPGQWHIPYEENIQLEDGMNEIDLVKISTSVAARGSYGKFNGKNNSSDLKLHDELLKDKHMSPFSHCSQCPTQYEYNNISDTKFLGYSETLWTGNPIPSPIIEKGWFSEFHGFRPYRYMIERNLI
jgi:hypothetical protein